MNATPIPAYPYERLQERLRNECHTWLVTGVAGFIGSHLLEALLKLDQRVVGIDNFSTGHQRNLDEVRSTISADQWRNFQLVVGDIRDLEKCLESMNYREIGGNIVQVEYVLHQAALGSVPRSLADPITTNATNITGFLNMLTAARDSGVTSFTYAASSSTYGDHPGLPKVEHRIGKPLSPYAVTKLVNEHYAEVFSACYGFHSIGLRYFNVFGPRQDPNGAYAAVIPKWSTAMLEGANIFVNGDGETSRDFCYIDNVVQANLLAATVVHANAVNQVYNVAVGERTSLNRLFVDLRTLFAEHGINYTTNPLFLDFRRGDVLHSQADIDKAKRLLGYTPTHTFYRGLQKTVNWYVAACRPNL